MSINLTTTKRVINTKGNYYTNKGNVHRAIPVYDDEGELHGHLIMTINQEINGGKPFLNRFQSLVNNYSTTVNYWTALEIKKWEGNYYCTKLRKYRAYSLYNEKGKYMGFIVYSYKNDGSDKTYMKFFPIDSINSYL